MSPPRNYQWRRYRLHLGVPEHPHDRLARVAEEKARIKKARDEAGAAVRAEIEEANAAIRKKYDALDREYLRSLRPSDREIVAEVAYRLGIRPHVIHGVTGSGKGRRYGTAPIVRAREEITKELVRLGRHKSHIARVLHMDPSSIRHIIRRTTDGR